MDDELNRLMKKLEQFKKSHIKVQLIDREKIIKQQYERFLLEYEGEANSYLLEDKNGITITIAAESILSCEGGGDSFNRLVGLASFTDIKVINNKLAFTLWFRCWEWIEH